MKKIIRILVVFGLCFLAGVFFNSIKNTPQKPIENNNHNNKDEIKEEEVSLIMAGDALIHSSIYKDAYDGKDYNFNKMLTYIKPIVQSFDLAFYNQETIIGGKDLGLSTYPRFNSPEEIGDAMINVGFNIVSLANNHTLDRGEKAILHSLNYWDSKEVMTAGSYLNLEHKEEIDIRSKNNITYTLLAYTTNTNGLNAPAGKPYYVDIYNKDKVKNDILRIRDKTDVLLVSMHWGEEYTHTPTKQQEEIANYLAGLGVDIIIGHHPHVIQPIKMIDNTLVIYSLGNFISAQNKLPRLIGMMVSLKIKKKVINEEKKLYFENITADLIYTYYDKSFRNFKVIPFTELTEVILPNYEKLYTTYSSIITNYDDSITVLKKDN